MSKININGIGLKLDLMDIDTMCRYEQCMEKVVDRVRDKKQYEGLSNAESFKYQCHVVEDFFDKLFGEGTAEKVFAGKENNFIAHLEAFAAVAHEGKGIGQKMDGMITPFMSKPNRAQRRAGDKKKKAKGKKK